MVQGARSGERRTSVDDIFNHLKEEILSLRLRPGDKISEADIALNRIYNPIIEKRNVRAILVNFGCPCH